MLTHRNMVKMAESYDQIDPAYPTDNHVSFLPLPWVGEQMTAVAWNLYRGFVVNFPEKIETVAENIREVGPEILFAPPRFWERICSDMQVRIQDAVWIKRFFYKLCMPIGYKTAEFRLANKRPTPAAVSVGWDLLLPAVSLPEELLRNGQLAQCLYWWGRTGP